MRFTRYAPLPWFRMAQTGRHPTARSLASCTISDEACGKRPRPSRASGHGTSPTLGTAVWLPVAPAEFRFDFKLDWDRADRLRTAERVVVRAWGQTSEAPLGTFVPLRAEQDLWMQLGAKLFTRIES